MLLLGVHTCSAFSPTARPSSPARTAVASSAPLLARAPPPQLAESGSPLAGIASTLLIGGLAYFIFQLVGVENLADVTSLGYKDEQFPNPNQNLAYAQEEEEMSLDEVVKLGGIGVVLLALLLLNLSL